MQRPIDTAEAVTGAILGCAVGDALGLPYEGLSRRRGVRMWGAPERYRFLFGHGMVSDDTEHTCMVAQALCESPGDPELFARRFARRLRWWLLGLPAGIGFATLRATLKLWMGFPPSRSGVFSAGNGPAMRSAVLGAATDDLQQLERFVAASTAVTHSDPKAQQGALAVAFAACCAKRGIDRPESFFGQYRELPSHDPANEFAQLMTRVERSLLAKESTEAFAEQLGCGCGVSGYIFHTVPVTLHAWLSNPRDFHGAVAAVIRCGGDADTTAAIVGAIAGSGLGRAGIPPQLLANLWEWPRTVNWMARLGHEAAKATETARAIKPPRLWPLVGLARNLLFLIVVLLHALRRFLPPY